MVGSAGSPYRGTLRRVYVIRGWKEVNWGGELRLVGTVSGRFENRQMMTAPILGRDHCPIRVKDQPDLLDDGMLVESVSGSRYLLNGRENDPSTKGIGIDE